MDKKAYESQKKKQKTLIIVLAVVVVIAIAVGVFVKVRSGNSEQITVSVGSKDFTEQQILGHLVADVIETNPKYVVDRKVGLGGTSVVWEALKQGSINMYVEYSAGMYLNHLQQPYQPLTKDEIVETITPLLKEQGIVLGPRLGFWNNYELSVLQSYADEHNLKSIADLKAVEDEAVFAPTSEYYNREDGMLGLSKIYGLNFKNITPMDGGLKYTALDSGEVDIITSFTTDGTKFKMDIATLDDPEQANLTQEACLIYNQETVDQYPDLLETLSVLEGAITPEEMIEMNYKVDVEEQTPEDVAKAFLQEKGIIK